MVREENAFPSTGFASTKSFSLIVKVGTSRQIRAKAARITNVTRIAITLPSDGVSAPQINGQAYPSADPKIKVNEIAVEIAVSSSWLPDSSAISALYGVQ